MGYVDNALEEIRSQIAADDEALRIARERRDAILSVARTWPGAQRTFSSGSLAHFTVNAPVSDADCGVVLDHDEYPDLTPDGSGEGPSELLARLQQLLGPELRLRWPDAVVRLTKRAIKVQFRDPLADGQDPTVDLVVAFDRNSGPGLWIPNRDTDTWDPSHPEAHTEMFRGPSESVAQVRRRAIRLAKAWNKQFSQPCMCSFNIEAIALAVVTSAHNVSTALLTIFEQGSEMLAEGEVEDPAGVSGPIKLPIDREAAVSRLQIAKEQLSAAIEATEESDSRDWLSKLFPDHELPAAAPTKSDVAAAIRTGSVFVSDRISPVQRPGDRAVKPVRSWSNKSSFQYKGSPRLVGGLLPKEIERFEKGLRRAYPGFARLSTTKGLRYVGRVDVESYGGRDITIAFSSDRDAPRVEAEGLTAKHRNHDDSLCLWYPEDPVEQRWTWEDGLVALIDLVRLHLFKESWWRETGEWLGPEAPHAA